MYLWLHKAVQRISRALYGTIKPVNYFLSHLRGRIESEKIGLCTFIYKQDTEVNVSDGYADLRAYKADTSRPAFI